MAFVEVGLAFGASEAFAGIVGSAAVGAAVGGGYSALTGDGNVLNSALTGATIGGAFGAMAPTAGFNAASLPSTLAAPTSNVVTQLPGALNSGSAALGTVGSASVPAAGYDALSAFNATAPTMTIPGGTPPLLNTIAEFDAAGYAGTSNGVLNQVPGTAPYSAAPSLVNTAKTGLSGKEMLGYGLAGTAALSLLGSQNQPKIQTPSSTSYIRPYTYAQTRNPNFGKPGENYYIQGYTAQPTFKAAQGGLMGGPVEQMSQINAGVTNYPQSGLDHATYAVASQMPTSAEVVDSDYDVNTSPYTGDIRRLASGGSTDSGYIPTSQAVQDYSKMLSNRAIDEYINNPMPSALMPASQRQAPPPTAPTTPQAPAVSQDINGLYQYYLGRQPGKDEIGQWSSQINGPVTPEMANYFQQFTGGELAKTGYKPTGPNPFLGQAPIPMSGSMASSAGQAGLPQYTYNAATRSYVPVAQAYTPFIRPATPASMLDSSQGGGAAGGMMPNALRYDRGGKAEDDNFLDGLSEKEKKSVILDLMAQSLKPMPGSQYTGMMNAPQGAFGRVGASKELDDNSKVRAGLSGVAMAVPGQHGVKTMPGSMDVGYTTARNYDYDPYLDLSAYRSINPMPGRGHAQGVNARYTVPFVGGGQAGYNLGGYSDGGRLLKGPGDGMSDNIPASIGNRQPARLADGEFVVPADVVSHLGNGSTDAGAKKLYAMMDKVRQARTGNKQQGKQIKAEKYLKT